MIKVLSLFFLLFSFGCEDSNTVPNKFDEQANCELQKQLDSIVLTDFSKQLNYLASARNLEELSKLFHFPFPYGLCELDGKGHEHQTCFISKEDFVRAGITDFFGVWFTETVSKGYIYSIMDAYYAKD